MLLNLVFALWVLPSGKQIIHQVFADGANEECAILKKHPYAKFYLVYGDAKSTRPRTAKDPRSFDDTISDIALDDRTKNWQMTCAGIYRR